MLKNELMLVEKSDKSIEIRRVVYWDSKKEKIFKFITNDKEISPDKVADIHKKGWQIKTIFNV